jgi:23S rRNA pseudouridine1911/1915/1917 synthase
VNHSEFDDAPSPTAPPRRQRARRLAASVLYADTHLLIVDKPAGALSVSGRGDAPTVAHVLIRAGLVPSHEPFRIVHRLDKDASGVMVFARTLEAQRSLTSQFERREVRKTYLALVRGYVAGDGEVDQPIYAGDGDNRARVEERRGRPSVTRYRVVERLMGNTLLECEPLTGRLHQIRVHLAYIGHPLSVDPVYGGCESLLLSSFKPGYKPDRRDPERPLISRLTLHSLRLGIIHPEMGVSLELEAAMPKDFRATLQQLRHLR